MRHFSIPQNLLAPRNRLPAQNAAPPTEPETDYGFCASSDLDLESTICQGPQHSVMLMSQLLTRSAGPACKEKHPGLGEEERQELFNSRDGMLESRGGLACLDTDFC